MFLDRNMKAATIVTGGTTRGTDFTSPILEMIAVHHKWNPFSTVGLAVFETREEHRWQKMDGDLV